jgi:hypothetical protein
LIFWPAVFSVHYPSICLLHILYENSAKISIWHFG